MSLRTLRRWCWVHKWTSLLCTAFLLLICVTGLPLVFKDELEGLLDGLPYASVPAGTPNANLDHIADISRSMYPADTIAYIFVDDDEPKIQVGMVKSWQDFRKDPRSQHAILFDAHTAQVLRETKPFRAEGRSFLEIMLALHRELLAGLPGELFLAVMAFSFVLAIISGVVIYAPFMRKLAFGTIRSGKSRRTKWLDIHNLLGGVTIAWTLVVGTTGLINELSTPLFALWQQTDVRAMLATSHDKRPPVPQGIISPQAALDKVVSAFPDMTVTSVVYPGSPFGSPYHFLVWTKGRTALTARLFSPVLVDAKSGELVGAVTMPWYLRALEISRPLHFGDYGGLPLKIIWALLDLVTIAVLGSGLYLWLSRKSVAFGDVQTDVAVEFMRRDQAASKEAAE